MLACFTVTLCYAIVYVAYGIKMLEVPSNRAAAVGDSLTVRCRINLTMEPDPDVHGPGTIMWNRYRGFTGSPFVIGSTLYEDYYRHSVYFLEWRVSELTINPIEIDDAALYGCTIVAVQKDFYFRLIVLETQPVCTSNSTGDLTVEGQPLMYVCQVTYVGPWAPVMQWSTSNPNITSYENSTWTVNKTVTSSFVVEPYREDNGGKVFCKTYFEDIDPSTVIEGQAKNAPEYVHLYTSVMDVYYPVRNISVHPLWYAYVPGDLITAVADGNPPPRFTWAVLSVVDVSGVSTNSTNSTNSSNSANSANSTNSTTAAGSRWNSSELTVTPDMIGSNWTVVVTAYNNIFGVESSLEVVVNFTVIAVRISPAIEVSTERTTTTTARPMPPIVTRTPVTTTEGDAEPPPVVAEKAAAVKVKSSSLMNVLAGGFAAIFLLILVIAVVALATVGRIREGPRAVAANSTGCDFSWFDDMHQTSSQELTAVKTDGTYSGTYYTANDQGMSGLKLMGLMAAATAPFQQKLSNELMGSQHKVEGEHKLPAKQHPISPLVMEQPPPEIETTKKKRSKRAREKKKQIEIENLGVSDPDAETKPDIDGETPKANLPFPEIKESATNADNNHLQVPKTKRKKKRKKPQQDAAPEMQPETVLQPETTAQEDDRKQNMRLSGLPPENASSTTERFVGKRM